MLGYFRRGWHMPDLRTKELLEKHRKEEADLRNSTALKSKGFFKSFWQLTKPYWFSVDWKNKEEVKDKAISWTFFLASLGLTFYNVNEIAVGFTEIGRDINNLMQNVAADKKTGDDAMSSFTGIVGQAAELSVWALAVAAVNYKIGQLAILRWRIATTKKFKERWLKHKNFYHAQHGQHALDNIDQRIHEDPRNVSDALMEIVTSALDAALSIVVFSSLLYKTSPDLNLGFMGLPGVVVPKVMFTFAIAYNVIGAAVAYSLGKPLERAAQKQQAYEGTFRADLINVREKAEQIALNQAEKTQKGILSKSLDAVNQNYKKVISTRTNLLVMRVIFNRISGFIPIMVLFPSFVQKKITLGNIAQSSAAFSEVQGGMSWYVNSAPLISVAKSSMNRLVELDDLLTKLEEEHDLKIQENKKFRTPSNRQSVPKVTNPKPSI